MKNDSLGDRIKSYESSTTTNKLFHTLPIICRLDGCSFHTFTRGLKRPYDERLSRCMIETTKYLCKLTSAKIGYTQSDEITLVLNSDKHETQVYFDAKLFKISSVLASKCSVYFNQMIQQEIPEKAKLLPAFDCRVFNVPSKEEALNTLIWREQDATRNSVSMAAQSFYSHRELHGKSSSEMQEMIFQKGMNWNDYPVFFKRGTYIQRKMVESTLSFKDIPEKHNAKSNPDLLVKRSVYQELDIPILSRITNRVDFVFNGETPLEMKS
jgi:tRNA(His) guanylyltransferase